MALIFLLPLASAALGQDDETHAERGSTEHGSTSDEASHPQRAGHEFHKNHFGGFLGGSWHLDSNNGGPTLGLEYTRQFSRRWGATAYVEMVSSSLERDFIVAIGAVFYPTKHIGLIVAPGFEQAEKGVEEHGAVETETELELLIRLGAGYGFHLTPDAALGPAVFIDWTSSRATLVVGLSMVVGF